MPDRDASAPVILSESLLEELADRWRQQDASIAGLLRTGLSHDEMDDLTAPIGITLPKEARTWWGWHDGAFPALPSLAPASLGPQLEFLPLADAVRSCVEIREIMCGVDGQLDPVWKYEWLPLTLGHLTLLDCSVAVDAPVPVRYYRFEEPETGAEGVPSIGTLITLYIDALDRGEWFFDHSTDYWGYDETKANPATSHLHLA